MLKKHAHENLNRFLKKSIEMLFKCAIKGPGKATERQKEQKSFIERLPHIRELKKSIDIFYLF